MNKLIANFIWGVQAGKKKFHLSSLSNTSKPKSFGGWGLLDLKSFGKALLCNSLWRGVFGEGPWSNIICVKYLRRKSLAYWLRRKQLGSPRGSPVWHSLRNIGKKNSGKSILAFSNRWKYSHWKRLFYEWFWSDWDSRATAKLFPQARHFLLGKSYCWMEWSHPPRKDADHLRMLADIASLWDIVKVRLRNCGIFRSKEHDNLIWKSSKVLYEVQVKDVYKDLISKVPSLLKPSFPAILWKSGCPLKMILFAWLAFHNRNLTWDNLRKRGWQGPGVCSFCWAEEESNFHLFFPCKKTRPL